MKNAIAISKSASKSALARIRNSLDALSLDFDSYFTDKKELGEALSGIIVPVAISLRYAVLVPKIRATRTANRLTFETLKVLHSQWSNVIIF